MLRIGNINEAISRATVNRSRLIFVSDKPDNHSIADFEAINLNKVLSGLLINTSRKERASSVQQIVGKLIAETDKSEVVLQGIEILFDRSLSIDPIRLFKDCSLTKTLIVFWPGSNTDSGLYYAKPNHPEYRSYRQSDLSDVIFLESDDAIH